MLTKQLSLFDPRPLAHRADPQTSYDAADKVIQSGQLNKQEQEVLEAIREYGGRGGITAKELSAKSVLNYFTIQRRLSGLVGRIEFLTIDGRWVFSLNENNRPAIRDGCRILRVR
jgi:hypothetical protein